MSIADKFQEMLKKYFKIAITDETAEHLLRLAKNRGEDGYVQWMTNDGRSFFPATMTKKKLSPGIYEISRDPMRGLFLEKVPVNTEGLIRLPDTDGDKVIDEIRKFWNLEDMYRFHKLNYKRGILLHGPAGSGKSCIIRLICDDVVERGGIVIKFTHPDFVGKGLRILRGIQPKIPVVVLMEDLDSLVREYVESDIINLLDGIDMIDKVVFLGTTNYPEELGDRIVNRPSRFDRRFFIGPPNAASRELYFKHLTMQGILTPEEIERLDIARWVADTENMSLAHLKELFVAVVILETPYDEALETLRSMDTLPSSKDYDSRTKGDSVDAVEEGPFDSLEPVP